ncbi:MAG: hypothetical protein C0514_03310 [Candidatus Puniceispirillum sp.]|nr:hypothetical protein [Candidatus Puniceispirillum sp.]
MTNQRFADQLSSGSISKSSLENALASFTWWRGSNQLNSSELQILESNERAVKAKLAALGVAEEKKASQKDTRRTIEEKSPEGVSQRALRVIGSNVSQTVREARLRGVLNDYLALESRLSSLSAQDRKHLAQAREYFDDMKDVVHERETTDLLARVLGAPSSAHTASSSPSTQPSPEPTPMSTTSTSSTTTAPAVSPEPTLPAEPHASAETVAPVAGDPAGTTSHGSASTAPSSSQPVGGTPEPSTPTHTQSETDLPTPTPGSTRPTQSLGDLPQGTRATGLQGSLDVLKDRPAPKAGARRLPTREGRRATQSTLEEKRAAQYEGQVTALESLANVLPGADQAGATSQAPSQEEVRQVRESVANVEKVTSSLSSGQLSRLAAVKDKLSAYEEVHPSTTTDSNTNSSALNEASTSAPVPAPKTSLLQEIEGGKELSSTHDRDAQRAAARAQRIAKVRERMGELGTLAPEGKEALKKEVRTLLSTASDSERAELVGMQKALNPTAGPRAPRPGSSSSSSSSTQRPVGPMVMPPFDPSKVPLRSAQQAQTLSGDPSKSVNPSELEAALKRRADAPSSSTTTTDMSKSLLLPGRHGGTPGLPLSQPGTSTAPARPGIVIKKVTPESMLEKMSAAKGQPIEKQRDVLKEVSNYLQRPALSTQDKERVEAAYNALKEEVDPTPKLVIRPAPPRSSSSRTPGTDTSAGSSNQVPSADPAPSASSSSSGHAPQPSVLPSAAFSTSPVDGGDTSVPVSEAPAAPGSALLQVLSSSAETFTGYKSRVSTPGGTQPPSVDRQPFLSRSVYFPGHGGLLPITLFPRSRASYGMGTPYGNLTQPSSSTSRFMPSDEGNGADLGAGSDMLDARTTTAPAAPPSDNTQPLVVTTAQRSSGEGQTDGGTTSFGGRFLGGLRSLASSMGLGSRQASQGDALTAQSGAPSVPGVIRGSSSFRPGDDGQSL